jgi:hypothetical protein
MSEEPVLDSQRVTHCVAKIAAIIAQKEGDRRSILQLGYNLGRLSELTGLGRECFWDRWKTSVGDWNLVELKSLVQELQMLMTSDDCIQRTDTPPVIPNAEPESP